MLILRSKDKNTPIEETVKIMAVSYMVDLFVHHPQQHDHDILQSTWQIAWWQQHKATVGLLT